ncbi:hypothetical protein EG329_001236 [Mollisiaceae sp. DMI_Dod_QoI]|nr:hypothetical protein EG329_001236 [Helotiales sp. DMI_Dod_QoI]
MAESVTSSGFSTPNTVSERSETHAENWYKDQWEQALKALQGGIDEVDQRRLSDFATCDRLLEHLTELRDRYSGRELSISQLLSQLEPSLKRVNGFAIAMGAVLRWNFFEMAVLWGVFSLIVECAKDSEEILEKIIGMIQQLTHDMEIFRIHKDVFTMESRMDEALVEIYMAIIKWGVFCIRFMGDNQFANLGKNAWPTFRRKFEDACNAVNTRMAQIKELILAYSSKGMRKHQQTHAQNIRQLEQLSMQRREDKNDSTEFKPCNNIPMPRNDSFFGRQVILSQVRLALDHDSSNLRLRSLALWGTGGIGKTQIALAYARERKEKGVKAIFWISCETQMARNQSYTEVALLLSLQGASEENHDQNRLLVTKWLQKTDIPWLIIFDNVELSDPEQTGSDMLEYWPQGDCGSVLVTSRHKGVSLGPASSSLEVLVFTPAEGSAYFQKALKRSQYSTEEIEAGEKLTSLLGGLPLALHIMTSHIMIKDMSIQQFIDFYEKNMQRLHNPSKKQKLIFYYSYTLATCWVITFEAMEKSSRDACSILATLCFVSPDNIPQDLFSPTRKKRFPEELTCCYDSWSFEEALETLLDLSIIRREPGADMSIHRIIQSVYRDRMTHEERYRCFLTTSTLLLEAFPKQVNGESLRQEWAVCRRFEQHAFALVVRYREFDFKPQSPGDFLDFTQLMTNVAWYLIETGSWVQCLEMINAGLDACEDKESLWYAHLCASAACVHAERAHTALARPFFKESIRVREKLLASDHQELANIYASFANMILTEQESPTAPQVAIDLYDRAIDIDNSKPAGPDRYEYLFIRYINRGFALACQNKYDEAYIDMEKARDYALKKFGPGSHWEADVDYNEGFIFYQKGDWDMAKKLYQRCLQVYVQENELHPATTATWFKLACVDLKQGNTLDAINGFRKTEVLCTINEPVKGDKGETARVWRRLAEALEKNGQIKEAIKLKSDAEAVRKEIQGERYKDLPDTEFSYNLM